MSRIDLDQKTREALVTLLNARLADGIDLALAIKQAHWNVKHPQFIQLHLMFDELRTRMDVHVDDLAERAVILAGTAVGTLQTASSKTTLTPYPTDLKDGIAHAAALADRYAAFGKGIRAAIETADGLGDAGSADLFTGISRAVDKDLWFLEAHLSR